MLLIQIFSMIGTLVEGFITIHVIIMEVCIV